MAVLNWILTDMQNRFTTFSHLQTNSATSKGTQKGGEETV
jgi:hypothetical protein